MEEILKIRLRACCEPHVHVSDSLCLNKWCSIGVSEVYFNAKFKIFSENIAYCVCFANFFTFSVDTHICLMSCLEI